LVVLFYEKPGFGRVFFGLFVFGSGWFALVAKGVGALPLGV